jgi:hypothetical protein
MIPGLDEKRCKWYRKAQEAAFLQQNGGGMHEMRVK